MFKQRLVSLFSEWRVSESATNGNGHAPASEPEATPAKSASQSALADASSADASSADAHSTDNHTGIEMALVERDDELARLKAYWQAAVAGHGRVVMLAGEAGSGKSMLADMAMQLMEAEKIPCKVARAACSAQSGEDEPFWPFADVMSQLVTTTTSKKLTEEVLDAFLEFAPSWVSVIPVAGPVVGASLQTAQVMRNRSKTSDSPNPDKLLREYVGALKRVTEQKPVLIFIDDLHWSDAMSIRLLSHLARSIRSLKCLIVCAYRPSDIAVEGHPLHHLINELLRYDNDAQVELRPLSLEGVKVLLGKRYPGHKFQDTLAEYLFNTTGGAPLFIVESLQLMERRGEIGHDSQDGRWMLTRDLNEGDLPSSVEAIINKRLERLPAELQDILAHAAVEGTTFDAAVLAYVLGKDELTVMKLLEPAEMEHDIIDYEGDIDLGTDVTVRYRFTSNLFQRQLLETLRGKKRLMAFRKTAQGLDRMWPDDSADMAPKLAQLYEQGKVFDSTARYLIVAGQYARQAGSITRAIGLYERAERNLNRYTPTDADDELQVGKYRQNMDEALSYLYDVDSSYDKSETRTRRALARGLDALGWPRYASLQMRLAALAARAGRLREALSSMYVLMSLLDSAQPEDAHSYEAFQLRSEICKMLTLLGRSNEAIQEAEATLTELDLLPELGWKRSARARVNTALTLAYHECGDYRRAISLSEETLTVVRELNMISTFAALLSNLTDLYLEVGDYDKAQIHIQMMIDAAQDTSNENLLATAHMETGLSWLLRHQDSEALNAFNAAMKWAEQVKTFDSLPKLMAFRAWALLELNQPDAAAADAAKVAELARDAGSPEWTAYNHLIQARLAEAHGNLAETLEQAQAAADIFREEGTRFDEAIALRVVARAQRGLGQMDAAAKSLGRAIDELRLIGNGEMARQLQMDRQAVPVK